MPAPDIFLTVIFPAYNEAGRIASCLEKTITFLKDQPCTSEIIVVENGSTDATLQIARSFQSRFPSLQVIHLQQRGKGAAVKHGMLLAKGSYRIFCDVDLSMPVEQVARFLQPELNADVIIGSREVPGAVRYNEPAYRHWIGRVFNGIVRILALPGIQDSQCGFKCFSERAAGTLFPLQTISGWSFDVELLYIARKLGFSIHELGIPWYHDAHSKVKVIRDSIQMFKDLLRIRLNDLQGRYGTGV